MKTNSQKQNILNHLLTGASLTCEQCRDRKWGSNLSQRIFNLVEDGHVIHSKEESHEGGHHSVYYICTSSIIKMIENLDKYLDGSKLYNVDTLYCIYKDRDNQFHVNVDGALREDRNLLFKVYRCLVDEFSAIPF